MDVSNEHAEECHVSMDVGPSMCEDEERAPSRVDEILEPRIGMEFESDEDALSFYNAYASRVGFSIRSRITRYAKRYYIPMSLQFVCYKEGFYANRNDPTEVRTGCKAMVKVKRKESRGKWVLYEFHEEHNHDLVIPLKDEVGPVKVMNTLSEPTWGLVSSRRDKDAQAALDYFKNMQVKDSSFFYLTELDEEGHFIGCFWADARCRSTYSDFGDAVKFDTTYLHKKYRLPLASFEGVNHHGQSVLFGCALIANVSKESFVWLFNAFLKAMFGRQPVSIITDQDRAIKEAVAEVFPESYHRFGMWHIYRKFPEKLSHVCFKYTNFQSEFEKCVDESRSIDGFEERWNSLLSKFHLKENNWLEELFEDRLHWVSAYFEPKFFVGMSATERTESMQPFFQGYVKVKTSFEDFINIYDIALASQSDEEFHADFQTINTVPKMRTKSPLETQMAQLYTHEMFKKFQNEIFKCFGYYANEMEKNGEISKYIVKQYNDERKAYTVVFNASEIRANCSCKMFEEEGILCKHVLVVFTSAKVSEIPSHYILNRWMRNARHYAVSDGSNTEVGTNCLDSYVLRYNDLYHKYLKIVERGARTVESYDVAMQTLEEGWSKVSAVGNSVMDYVQIDALPSGRNCGDLMEVSEAAKHLSTKGRTSSMRPKPASAKLKPAVQKLKPAFQKGSEKSRMCSICGVVGHDMRTCTRHQEVVQKQQLDQVIALLLNQNTTHDDVANI